MRAGSLAALLLAALASSSHGQAGAPRDNVFAKLIGTRAQPLIELGGTARPDTKISGTYDIRGYLRRLPCTNRTYDFALGATLGTAVSTYEAKIVLRLVRGPRLACNRPLPRELGRRYARIRIYPKDVARRDAPIIVNGRRVDDTAIDGTLVTRAPVCRPAWLEAKFSRPSGSVTLLYDMEYKQILANGRPCR